MDLCIVTDTTQSMGAYLNTLLNTFNELMYIFKLCNNIDRVSVLGYKDYVDKNILQWSGWKSNTKDLIPFIQTLSPSGGGDVPEAAKTAAWYLLKVLNEDADIQTSAKNITFDNLVTMTSNPGNTKENIYKQKKTMVIWYTDAPPHTSFTGSSQGNISKEKHILADCFDWTFLSHEFGNANIETWFLLRNLCDNGTALYTYMSQATGGQCINFDNIVPDLQEAIGKVTIGIILATMGYNVEYSNVHKLIFKSMTKVDKEVSFAGKIVSKSPMCQTNIDGKKCNIINKAFNEDKDYKDCVYAVFNDLLNPRFIKSITYNPLFGSLWREICKDRKDPRRTELMNKLSKTVSNMTPASKFYMQEFIEKTYNNSDTINDMISELGNKKLPALIISNTQVISKLTSKEILEVTRSCSPSSLQMLCGILTSLQVTDSVQPLERFVPLAFGNPDLFMCIPHLIVEGVMLSKRASVVLAMVVVYTGCQILLDRATSFLIESSGTWLKFDQPENFSYEFIKLVLIVNSKVSGFLKTEERSLFNCLHTIGGLKINYATIVKINIPFTSCKTKRHDSKITCKTCEQKRSFTLITNDGSCGLCKAGCGLEWPCVDESMSYWCECRKCKVHYAVEDVKGLSVEPKCHWCRSQTSKTTPSIQCSSCFNKFACEATYLKGNKNEAWECPICINEQGCPSPQQIDVKLWDYLHDVKSVRDIFGIHSLWSIYELKVYERFNITYPETHGGKPILNTQAIIDDLNIWIALAKAEKGTCMLCFSEMSKSKLHNVCGRRNCTTQACSECLSSWYGEPKPGHMLSLGNLRCPFCRKSPDSHVVKKYNKELCTLKQPKEWDNAWEYAWCLSCYSAKTCIEKVCNNATNNATNTGHNIISRFHCHDCKSTSDKLINCKECPVCQVMVEKSSGCDHITCSCGTHWCFSCSHVSTRDEIYDHMWNVHGSIGLVDGGDGDSEDEGSYDGYSSDEY